MPSAFPASASSARTGASIPAARPPRMSLGLVNVDNQGIAGIEKYVDDRGSPTLHGAGFARGEDLEPVKLSIDVRVQHILRDELAGRDATATRRSRRPASSSTCTPAK